MAQLHVIQSSRDQEEAGRIIDQLKASGHAVSVDYNFLKPGMEWKRALSEAVSAADGLIAVLSANSVDIQTGKITSQWIAADIGAVRASGKFAPTRKPTSTNFGKMSAFTCSVAGMASRCWKTVPPTS